MAAPDIPCQICNGESHGSHFNVIACRACAAFYRRTLYEKRVYTCKKEGNCDVTEQYRQSCRACRMKKCIDIGMDGKSMQLHREATGPNRRRHGRIALVTARLRAGYPPQLAETTPTPILIDGETNLEVKENDPPLELEPPPKLVKGEEPRNSTTTVKQQTIGDIEEPKLFAMPQPPPLRRFQPVNSAVVHWTVKAGVVERMQAGYKRLLIERRPSVYRAAAAQPLSLIEIFSANTAQTVEVVRVVRLEECMQSYRLEIGLIAEMVMLFEPFEKLAVDQKSLLFKNFWTAFLTLERCYQTIEHFGTDETDMHYMITNRHAISMDNFDIDTAESTNSRPKEDLMRLFKPATDSLIATLLNPLRRVKPNEFELMVMAGYLLWNVDGLPVTKATADAAESVKQQISYDLHSHYTTSMMNNYALRLTQLLSIVAAIEKVAAKEKEDMVMDQVFNLSQLDDTFSDLNF